MLSGLNAMRGEMEKRVVYGSQGYIERMREKLIWRDNKTQREAQER